MRLEEIITEQQLDERPMGFLGKLGAKAQKLVPGRAGRRAVGKLKIGDMANKLSDEFDEYLGMADTGEGATPELVIGFLKKQGYPTAGAEKAMKDPTFAQKAGSVVGKVAKGVKDTVSNIATGAKTGAQNANQPKKQNTVAPDTAKKQPIPNPSDTSAGNTNLAASIDRSNSVAITEGLSGAQLDKVFMAAAKEMVQTQQGGLNPNQDATGKVDDPADAGAGGFVSSFKQAFNKAKDGDTATNQTAQGSIIPDNIQKQLDQLDQNQRKELLRAL